MTEQDKQLLLKDLCTRLPYGVKFEFTRDNVRIAKGIDLGVTDDGKWEYFVTSKGASAVEITEIKPYLRPMESMTDEEQRTLNSMCYGVEMVSRLSGLKMFNKAFNWLNENHFDYRGLIPMGLAIEAPKDMYKED